MKKELEKIVKKAILEIQKKGPARNAAHNAAGGVWGDFELPKIEISHPKEEIFGDYSTNVAMIIGNILKKNPFEIAEIILGNIQDDKFEKIEVVKPGYINFYLAPKYFQERVAEINRIGGKFGNLKKKNEGVMVEYSQPNTHKEFHIGHLRNVFIGSSLVNLLKKGGYDVISANYIGDTGSHIAKCLWGIQKFHKKDNLSEVKDRAAFLGKAYSESVKAISENPKYENEFKELQNNFEKGDADLIELWKETRKWSLDEFQGIYEELGVDFDVYFWESEEEKEGKKMLPELLKTDFIRESQGAIIADLEKYNLGILVLLRKDGSALYGIKDIPLAIRKFKEYKIEKNIVIVDIRQELYFKQIFKILELIGFGKDMSHIGYDFVSLKGSETMSSRKGNVVPAKVLIEDVVKKTKEKFPETKMEKEIGLGALKFYMLKYARQSKIEFDTDDSVRLEGATGPYVQYAHARVSSILRKAQDMQNGKADLSLLTHEKELSLMREIDKFPELIEEIADSYEVHKLPHYAIGLADRLHSFYASCRVIDEDDLETSRARLNLINAVRIVLAETLRLIGVRAPEHM